MAAGHAHEPRVSVSRSVIPITTDEDRAYFGGRAGRDRDTVGFIDNSVARFGRTYTGEPDVIAEELAQDAAVLLADTLLLTVPNQLGVEYNARLLETIADTSHPRSAARAVAGAQRSPCSSTSLTDGVEGVERGTAPPPPPSRIVRPAPRPGRDGRARSAEARAAGTRRAPRPLGDHPLADHDVAEQPPLLADPDLGAERELARAAEVVDHGGGSSRSEFSRGCSWQSSWASVATATVCSSRPPR